MVRGWCSGIGRLLLPAGLALAVALVAGCGVTVSTGSPAAEKTAATASSATPSQQVTVTATPESPAPPVPPTPAATAASPHPRLAGPTRTPTGPAPVDLSSHDLPGFTTPSGNIGCLFDHYRRARVRCDRLQLDGPTPAKPADCDFDWGHSVELTRGRAAAPACVSDSVMGLQGETDGTRVLPYGDAVRYRGIVCRSQETGLRCSTRGGHGFVISRAAIEVW